MKKIENCIVENCIPTPSSCVEWNGGTIDYLGICNGDSLNNVTVEIVTKLQEIAGEDLSTFDIDTLLDVCNQKAPLEINITSILTILKNNDICLKDYIDTLSEQIAALSQEQNISVNLKCYADFDNLGNALSITRAQLDQLVIDNLCSQKGRIESLEGSIISLQSQIDNIDINPTVDELTFATCINANVLPTSTQVINTAEAHCDLETATGDPADISSALANTPANMNAEFGLLPGWILNPANLAENYNNLLIAFGNIWGRVQTIEDTCCAVTCDDIKIGYTAIYNEDNDGVIIKFTAGAGTSIPAGFTGVGSSVIITDIDGNTAEETITIANNSEHEISVSGLNLTGDLSIDVTAIITNGSLTCEKCVHKTLKKAACEYCEICVNGAENSSIVVIYETGGTTSASLFETTTTTSTTTTTTAAP